MDDIPECMRRRPRRQSILHGDAREVSADGDYVILRESRKNRAKPKSALEDLYEDDDEDDVSAIVQPSFPRQSSPPADTSKLKELVDMIPNGQLSDIENQISITDVMILTGVTSHEKMTNMNVLHVALHHKRFDVANALIDKAGAILASQAFTLPGTTRTALHQITECNNLHLAKKLLKTKSKEEKQRLVKEETIVKVPTQRPRTLSCFHMAAFNGFTKLVGLYLDTGIDVNVGNSKNDTALLWAARWGHNDTVSLLLSKGADPNLANDKISTALHWAVRYQHSETVKILLKDGDVNPNHIRSMGLAAPLILASAIGNNKIVKLLLTHSANVNIVIRGGECPLHHAAKEGYMKVLKTLLRRGADVNTQDEKGDTAINFAAQKGHADIVNTLLKHGADMFHTNDIGDDCWDSAILQEENDVLKVLAEHYPEAKKSTGFSGIPPLCVAAKLGRCKKLKTLLKMDMDSNEVDFSGNSYLHYAAMNNHGEVIRECAQYVDIDKRNDKDETALHIACAKGHEEAAFALMEMKAKTNIKNTVGETALHVVGYSPNSSAALARAVLSHTIVNHDWVSVNCTDDAGNNALHLAGKYAKPEVLWEFRFVRFKDVDVDGNTPLHEAVRPGCQEVLHTALDIYDNMQRDANINHPNNKGETVLHLAASAGFSECVSRLVFYGADLACLDSSGNTVLHRLVKAIVEDSDNAPVYMHVVETILQESVRWSCNVTDERFPSDNKSMFVKIQRKAVLSLINDFKNHTMLSVLGYACNKGCDVFLAKIFTMPDVMVFKKNGHMCYDITHLTPMTNGSSRKCCGDTTSVHHAVSLIELLVTTDSTHSASRVLNIPPIRRIEQMYSSIIAWVYAFLMFLHVAYMSAFTFLGIEMSARFREFRNGTFLQEEDSILVATYILVPLEPMIFLLNAVGVLLVMVRRRKLSSSESYTVLAVNLTLSCLTLTWLALVGVRDTRHDYVLAICLCIGWLYSITFTRGFKQIHYFWKMLLSMLTRDVFRFIIIFLFVILAFSFAFHALFQISDEITKTYRYPFDSMFLIFTTMVGMVELFTDEFDEGMIAAGRTTTFPKILYVFYIVLSTIILLNLLIAMMNDSYSRILKNQKHLWRVDSVKIGISVEHFIPSIPKYFGKCKITMEYDDSVGERWYLMTTSEEEQGMRDKEGKSKDSDPLGSVLEKQFKHMETRVDNIEKLVSENFEKVFDLLKKEDSLKKEKKPSKKSKPNK